MLADQITILNEVTLESLNENDEIKIATAFCNAGMKVLSADHGFVWLNSFSSPELKLVYKSPNLPFTPHEPRKDGRNYGAIKNSKPDFITDTSKVPDADYVKDFISSFVIIPLVYKNSAYGSMVFCFDKPESFPVEKKTLSFFIGNSVAQTITISRLISDERTEWLLEEERRKIRSVADANHELRTPIAIIQGNVELALSGKPKKVSEYIEALQAVKNEVKHLSGILSDLTLLTPQDEQTTSSVGQATISLGDLILDIVHRCEVLAKKKKISLVVAKLPETKISGNELYLEKMIINLVKNSIIYGSPGGHTDITMKKTKDAVSISISDTGIGIGEKDLPHIFERFYRATSTHTEEQEGTGLGLAIVKMAAELHGGSVSVKSTKGKGSTFTIILPLNKD